ncbi:hypothetical protein TIFTF001_049648, partial [Ficus carica]
MTSPVGDRMRYLPKPSRSLSGSHVFCLYGVYRVGPSIQKVCHSTIYTCLPPLKALGAATITGSSAASVVIAPTCHYATSAAGTGTASASAKERISGSLDLPNGFQYAYTRITSRRALNLSRASGSCAPHLCWWHTVPYCAEHSQKPWPSAMLDPPLEVQWLVPPELGAIRKFVPAYPGYNNYRTAIHLKNGARISLGVAPRDTGTVHRVTYPSVLPDSRICRTLIFM